MYNLFLYAGSNVLWAKLERQPSCATSCMRTPTSSEVSSTIARVARLAACSGKAAAAWTATASMTGGNPKRHPAPSPARCEGACFCKSECLPSRRLRPTLAADCCQPASPRPSRALRLAWACAWVAAWRLTLARSRRAASVAAFSVQVFRWLRCFGLGLAFAVAWRFAAGFACCWPLLAAPASRAEVLLLLFLLRLLLVLQLPLLEVLLLVLLLRLSRWHP